MSDETDSEARANTVLVVEDEAGLRFVISSVLREDAKLNVVEAASADDALSILRTKERIDLMFTDVRMPGKMDGIALTHQVKTEFPEMKIVMASGNMTPEERIEGIKLFPKPYDIDQVTAHIVAIISDSRAVS